MRANEFPLRKLKNNKDENGQFYFFFSPCFKKIYRLAFHSWTPFFEQSVSIYKKALLYTLSIKKAFMR